MELLQNTKDVPIRSTLIVWGEFLELTGSTPDGLSELMYIDFELHTLGGSIVMDLLDRIATLELRIRELTDR